MRSLLKYFPILSVAVWLFACIGSSPTIPSGDGKLALQLQFVEGELHPIDDTLKRRHGASQITRLEIYIVFQEDTLANATVPNRARGN